MLKVSLNSTTAYSFDVLFAIANGLEVNVVKFSNQLKTKSTSDIFKFSEIFAVTLPQTIT